ncbi:MAG: LysR family transcriptional regulator [Kiloniellales bacterium]|nr:LysR family transcriptional regulator [Kiloniellales bacterium]
MADEKDPIPLNAIRVFAMIAREASVTRAAQVLGITQSAASRHLAVLESYMGTNLIERRGRYTELTDFGRLFAEAVSEPLDSIAFAVHRMRRNRAEPNRIVVRTSLSTFAYTTLIPNLKAFSDEMNNAVVDVITSLSLPALTDDFDVLVTRDLSLTEPSDHWDLLDEQLVCAGTPNLVSGKDLSVLRSVQILAITSRPDIMRRWMTAMDIAAKDVKLGPRYDHHYLALPAVTTGQGLLIAPEIFISNLVRQGLLDILPDSRVLSGMKYRAYAVDRSGNPDLARSFCRWLVRLCRNSLSKMEA